MVKTRKVQKPQTTKTQVQTHDQKFIELFEKFNANEKLTHAYANKEISLAFPKFEAKGNKILDLIKWRVNNMEDSIETIETIFELIDFVVPKFDYSNSTIDNIFTKYARQPIMKRFGAGSHHYKLVKEMVALPDDVKGDLLRESSEKVKEKNKDRIVINLKEMLDVIRDNINTNDVFRRSIALLIASGSRSVELFEQANFTKYKNELNWVTQDFLAKKKGKVVPAIKPILFLTAEQFITELQKLRTDLKAKYKHLKEPGDLTRVINTPGNNKMKEIFKNREGFTLHFCRKLYGVISYKMYGQIPSVHGKNLDFHFWLSSVLGHEGQAAVANYSHITLDSETLVQAEVPEKVTELEAKITDIQEKLESIGAVPVEKELPTGVASGTKEANQLRKIKIIYNNYKEDNDGAGPTQTKLESLASEVASRRVIRLFHKWQKDSS